MNQYLFTKNYIPIDPFYTNTTPHVLLSVCYTDGENLQTYDRENLPVDPSPLESFFEMRFADAYGEEAYKYLLREYSIILRDGRTG